LDFSFRENTTYRLYNVIYTFHKIKELVPPAIQGGTELRYYFTSGPLIAGTERPAGGAAMLFTVDCISLS
jgi:hypothetical protein